MAEDRKFRWDEERKAFVNRVSGEAIPDDEPVMIFRARDKHALETLGFYGHRIQDSHHRQAVFDRVEEFARFRRDYPERMKEPGITRHIQLNSDRLCSICRQPQLETSSGVTCENGHGGADPE